jgi:hypothetical protein
MGRTVREIHVSGRGPNEVWQTLGSWFTAHGFTLLDRQSDGRERVLPRWDGDMVLHPRAGNLVAALFRRGGSAIIFELALQPAEDSTTIRFEGYVTGRGPGWKGKEYEFAPGALAIAGIPRKQGLELMRSLESSMTNLPEFGPSTAAPWPSTSGVTVPSNSAAAAGDFGPPQWIPTLPGAQPFLRLTRRGGTLLTVTSGMLFLFTLVFLYEALYVPAGRPWANLVSAGTAVGLFGLGIYALLGARRSRLPGLAAVGISSLALVLRWESGEPTVMNWTDPNFQLTLTDTRKMTAGYGAGSLTVGAGLSKRWGGLTPESCEALLRAIQVSRLPVKTKTTSGSWGQITEFKVGPKRSG